MDRDRGALLHEAINDLPRALRLALIVCDLQGYSPDAAAERLGWPSGKLRRRLGRARARLRLEMARRQVVPSRAAARELGPWLHVGEVAVSRRLIEATVAAAAAARRPTRAAATRSAAGRPIDRGRDEG